MSGSLQNPTFNPTRDPTNFGASSSSQNPQNFKMAVVQEAADWNLTLPAAAATREFADDGR